MNQEQYNQELTDICKKMKKSFGIKIGLISMINTNKCIKKLVKLNKKTKNQNINELIYVLGRTNLEYKKYCHENNYYTDPEVNKKIKEAYIKLSRKSMKIQSKKANIEKRNEKIQIQYNANKGSYVFLSEKDGKITGLKEYPIKNVKNLGKKRANIAKLLKKRNFGIDIFEELEIDENKFYKINPDIVNILLNEKKFDYAKKYIKEVVGGETETINSPLKIKYVLNKNLSKGAFGIEENKAMLKMAKHDSIASKIEFMDVSKTDVIEQIKNKIESFKERIYVSEEPKIQVNYGIKELKNVKNGNIVASASKIKNKPEYKNSINTKRKNPGIVLKPIKANVCRTYRNVNTGRIVAYGAR